MHGVVANSVVTGHQGCNDSDRSGNHISTQVVDFLWLRNAPV